MKYIYNLLLLLLIVFFFTSCNDDNGSLLIPSATQLTFGPSGGSQTLAIQSNTDWTVTSNESWLSVFPSSGSSNQTISVNVAISDNLLEREAKLVICTNDGEKMINVDIKVEGSLVKKGKYLDVTNHLTRLYMGGKAGDKDSLLIRSNMIWELKGPEWIEAWDGARWRPLSQNRGVVRGDGIQTVLLRSAADNKNEENINGVITVSEYLTGDNAYTVNVSQLGRLRVNFIPRLFIANYAAFGWTCGCDVGNIYFKVSEQVDSTPITEVRLKYQVTDANFINSADNLKANTDYILSVISEDKEGSLDTIRQYFTFSTGDTNNQPFVPIEGVFLGTDGNWLIYTYPNEYTYRFLEYVTESPNSIFMYSDAILFHLFFEKSKEYINSSGFFNCNSGVQAYNTWERTPNSNEVHVLTYGFGTNSTAYIFSRFDAFFDANGELIPPKPLLNKIPVSSW